MISLIPWLGHFAILLPLQDRRPIYMLDVEAVFWSAHLSTSQVNAHSLESSAKFMERSCEVAKDVGVVVQFSRVFIALFLHFLV